MWRVLVVAFFALATHVAVAAEKFGDITVVPASIQVNSCWHGYVEHRARLTNHSSHQSHTVKLVVPGQVYGGRGNHIRHIERTVVVGPGSSMSVSLYQPALEMSGSGMGVHIDGRFRGRMALLSTSGSTANYWRTVKACLLVSRSINSDNLANRLDKHQGINAKKATSRSNDRTYEINKAESGISEWSDNWLGYSCYDGVLLTDADLRSAGAAVRSALWRYVECGGSLIVFGDHPPPTGVAVHAGPARERVATYYVGFGRYGVCQDRDLTKLTTGQLSYLVTLWTQTRQPWQAGITAAKANRAFPVVGSITVPVRGIFLIVLGFAILIGPVTLIVLAKKNKRIWLLWIVPAVSSVTCIVVFLYSLLAEGITPSIRIDHVVLLDEQTKRATTLGIVGYYCPLTPGGGLRFGFSTELSPQVERNSHQSGTGRFVDWTREQHFQTGWISARVPAHFLVRKNELRRERLEIRRRNDRELSVVNGLGKDITRLWVADSEGKVYSCEKIRAGQQAVVTLEEKLKARASAGKIRSLYTKGKWAKLSETILKKPEDFLRPDSYIAELEDAPFFEYGLSGKARKKLKTVVIGLKEPSGTNADS